MAFLALLAVALPSVPARGQEGDPHARLRPLFGAAAPQAAPPQRKPAARPKAGIPRKGSRPASPAGPTPPKAADAATVLVTGDFFGQSLATGLADLFADEPSVRVEDAARAEAGLLRDDPADLLPNAPPPARPGAVVILIGGNDRQALRGESGRLPLHSAAWSAAYGGKAAALAQAAASRGVPLFWVGLPPVASAKASADFLAFNEAFRPAAEAAGAVFVDVWDGFVDEKGAFVRFGPGVDGQRARLRTKDGIGLTDAGRRKLAFFVRKPLEKALDLPPGPEPVAVQPGSPAPEGAAASGRTAPMPLDRHALRPGGEPTLLGGPAAAAPAQDTPFSLPSVPGRADDFSLPR